MMSPQNITAGTVVPVVINPESIPVDSNSEVDLEQIQQETAAKQRWIKEVTQAKLVAAHEHIEKKWQEQKVKEEEAQKAEEEEVWKWKEEEDKVIRDKALEEAQKQQLKVSC